MKIAFYAPMKPPDHPVPSGDRQMARLLMRALKMAGHEVELVSRLRSYVAEPSEELLAAAQVEAEREMARIGAKWRSSEVPELWICYHPYYKAPDLLGPGLAEAFSLGYVTIEASWAEKRATGHWAPFQVLVQQAVERSALNICFTERDRDGLSRIVEMPKLAILPPFIDAAAFPIAKPSPSSDRLRLISIAMFRKGDKFESFRLLAAALAQVKDVPWHLTIVGGGPVRNEVMELFSGFPPTRIDWHGEAVPEDVPKLLESHDLYVWPGRGEAYGLAYLEAQAMGLPVIAMATAGVPAVVRHGETGLLSPDGDIFALAASIERLYKVKDMRGSMSIAAQNFVRTERSLAPAAARLEALLNRAIAMPHQ
jgi:glycosyltransferase involved in cell wall biosynthesis